MKTNIPHSQESAIEKFLTGEQALREKHAAREKDKLGILRVGTAGCMISEDSCIGSCPQAALSRFLGYQLPSEASQPYFDGGLANEHVWETNVTAAGIPYKCEEDIPVVYELPDKTLITGRPDQVVGREEDGEFIPEIMFEHKATQAANSAASKLLVQKPDMKHVIQAATYSMFLGIPAILVYTSNISGGITNFFTKREAGVNEATFGKIEFKLGWEDGNLYYMKGSTRIDTIVTQQGILDFYSNIAKMAREGKPNLIYQDMKDIEGNLLPYNPRMYSDIPNLVDDELPFEEWKEKLANVTSKPYVIKYKTKRGYSPWYEVIQPDYEVEEHRYYRVDRFIEKFTTLADAREFVYRRNK
jgi:hypothetical protein